VNGRFARDEDHRAELADRTSDARPAPARRAGGMLGRTTRRTNAGRSDGAEGRRRLFGLAVELGEEG